MEEIKIYNANVKEKKHVYGKYGTLAKRYIEEHNFGKLLSLAGHLPEYLHGVDKAAEALYDVLWDKLSKSEKYCRTGNYLEDVKRINAMKQVIEDLYFSDKSERRVFILTTVTYESLELLLTAEPYIQPPVLLS